MRASRKAAPLPVVVLDLDNFKFFRDVYGHAVGDEVLRRVAKRLKAVCRPYDVVARFGGDEFALPLVGTELAAHGEIAARLRAQTGEGDIIRTIGEHHAHFLHYHTAGVPGRHDLDDTQELAHPPIIKAVAATGYQGYVGHEFIPKGVPVAALEAAYGLCDV